MPVVAAALLAGCSSEPVAPPAERSTAGPAQTTTAAVAAPPVTVTVTAPPSPVAAEPEVTGPCTDSDLVVSNKPLESQGSEYRLVLLFENNSVRACTLQGYPGADIMNETGPAVHVERREQIAAPLLTLQPGETAVADLQSSDTHPETEGPCPRWGEVVVIAPNTYATRNLGVGMPLCKALISSVT
ncbi:DUF4232 domain-containing protein [Mycolicibacterium sp. P9-22]|uniref:DUF4232 domain-containing protein n=1 Tax=Mycolicibacterium sp. P9-22 TaxID=2024613 RepID=UPI001883D0F8|nr:DUF4232 domain-containing protein [Mycolicibacterium sp. P9-22]